MIMINLDHCSQRQPVLGLLLTLSALCTCTRVSMPGHRGTKSPTKLQSLLWQDMVYAAGAQQVSGTGLGALGMSEHEA